MYFCLFAPSKNLVSNLLETRFYQEFKQAFSINNTNFNCIFAKNDAIIYIFRVGIQIKRKLTLSELRDIFERVRE
jgi:c-di-AMP phosphodiesterase-like protein